MRSSTTGTIAWGLRLRAAETERVGDKIFTVRACGPLRPSATPYSTRVPGLGAAAPSGSAEAWRNTSTPSSPPMKPKPRSASKNFTFPVGTATPQEDYGVMFRPPPILVGEAGLCFAVGTPSACH